MAYSINKLALAPTVGGRLRGKLTLQPGSETTGNMYGSDVMSRVFFGFTDEIYSLLPVRGVTFDKWLPGFLCDDFKVTEERGLTAIARVNYIGLVGRVPLTKIESGWSEQTSSVSITGTQGAYFFGAIVCTPPGVVGQLGFLLVPANTTIPYYQGGTKNEIVVPAGYYCAQLQDQGEASVSYNAPETTYTYVSTKLPNGPLYSSQLVGGSAAFQINEIRPATLIGRIVYALTIRTVKYDVVRQGPNWGVTEVTRGTLSSANIVSGAANSGVQTLNNFSQELQTFNMAPRNTKTYR